MSANRQVAKFTLLEGLKDTGFEKLSTNKTVVITAVHDSLTKEGDAIRIVDYLETVGEPVYKLPVC